MTSDLVTKGGNLVLPGEAGERRVPWATLVAMPQDELERFQGALSQAVADHPELDVMVLDDKANDHLVVTWRPRVQR